jgi:hypothetical protein
VPCTANIAAAPTHRLRERFGIAAAELPVERRGKRQDDFLYATIADRFVRAIELGSRSPRKDVALELPATYGGQFVAGALMKARKRKLLTPPESTRPVGRLTARGRRVLAAGPPAGYTSPLPPPN